MNVREYNRSAWDHQAATGNKWTVPVASSVIAAARRGDWQVLLTPSKPVPRAWFPDLKGCDLLCLASGGGQQGPVFAAAGANVTVLDNSPAQLDRDWDVAMREGLTISAVEGDMAHLPFEDASFDLIFHPVSNCFVPDVLPVWREAFRVLRPGGSLLAGFSNPLLYIFDDDKLQAGQLLVRHAVPYSDLTSLTAAERQKYIDRGEPLAFGHTLTDQIGGQLEAGFLLASMYEDSGSAPPLDRFHPTSLATRSVKPN
jgi:SAM-dependent methyltransferase